MESTHLIERQLSLCCLNQCSRMLMNGLYLLYFQVAIIPPARTPVYIHATNTSKVSPHNILQQHKMACNFFNPTANHALVHPDGDIYQARVRYDIHRPNSPYSHRSETCTTTMYKSSNSSRPNPKSETKSRSL